jgi:hypothetical protein
MQGAAPLLVVGVSARTDIGDVADGVRSFVAEFRSVRRATDSDGIQHGKERTHATAPL